MTDMNATFKSPVFLLVLTAVCVALYFASVHDNAEGAVLIPDRDIELFSLYDDPRGVWSDGSTLWVADNDHDDLFAYDLSTGSRKFNRDIALANGNSKPTGIWSDGQIMWVADWDDTHLYAYTLSNGQPQRDRDINLTGSNDGPRGIWGSGDLIYVVDKDDTYVYAYHKTNGNRMNAEEFDLAGSHDDPWGIWGEGSTVWISDLDDYMLYAYRTLTNSLSNVVRQESGDIRLPPENRDSRGIWSDGEIMWVVDDYDTHVYAMYFRDFRHLSEEISIGLVTTPTGLWTNGETMWVADAGLSGGGVLTAYSVSSGFRDSGKDVRLLSENDNPTGVWSDGTTVWVAEDESSGNHFLYAYLLDQDPNATVELQPYKSIGLADDNSDPVGAWSDGETFWVSDSADDKLYAYDLDDRTRQSDKEFDLHSDNGNPGGIWGDGQTVWVLDTTDKHVYAYRLSNGNRRKSKEFRPAPGNNNLTGGLTSHGLRWWVADSQDDKLYAYGKLNTPPTFSESSAIYKIHYTIAGDAIVGTLPSVTEPDGDTLTYSLSGTGSEYFAFDSATGEIRTATGATSFSGGDEFSLTASVKDSRNALDGFDDSVDDAINVTIRVNHNANPVFNTPDESTFTVAEDVTESEVIAEIEITDLDGDTLEEIIVSQNRFPFTFDGGEIKLKEGESLDYESRTSYRMKLRVKDNKNLEGQSDSKVDDGIFVNISVTNVNETGEMVLGSSEPEVGEAMTVSITDPDGIDFSNGNQVNWIVESKPTDSTWVENINTNSTSTTFEYTPVAADALAYLRFKAIYKDGFDPTSDNTLQAEADNLVLAGPPTNSPPAFDESPPTTRSIAEDAAGGSNVGAAVTATDPDEDTVTYYYTDYSKEKFEVDSETGQITLKADATLDYETTQTYNVRVIISDSKDAHGNADVEYDISRLVTISVANVDEAGEVELSENAPEFGAEITASLYDPDGSVANLTWQWQTADSFESTTWTDISGATSNSYVPIVADVGKYLLVKASYDDGEGTGKEATAKTINAVFRSANEPPAFEEGTATTRSINENSSPGTRVGAVVAASDPEDDTLTYSLASSTDSAHFEIDPATGRLEVASGAVLDYESDPDLLVVLQVTDGKASDHSQDDSLDDTISLTINLVNLDEAGSVTLSPTAPEVGTAITTTLTDPDGAISNTEWQWQSSQDGINSWTDITGATSDTYTPVSADAGRYLRATVTYTDAQGAGKTAQSGTAVPLESTSLVDTSLSSLELDGITFTFSSSTYQYNLNVPNETDHTTVTATASETSGVSVDITPADSRSGTVGHQVDFAEGETRITVTVSEDGGSASTTYSLLVTREPSEETDPSEEDPPQPQPVQEDSQQDNTQEDPPVEKTFAEKCREDRNEGLIAECTVTDFAVARVAFDGSYTIDWSEWDSENPGVTGYGIVLNELLYKMYYDGDRELSDDELADIYGSCEYSDGQWSCQGRMLSNYFEEWDGSATQITELVNNEDLTQWSSALESPGRHMFSKTFVRWSGDASDPDNEPTQITLKVKVIEMDLHHFVIYEGSVPVGREIIMVDGANGFDEVEG